MKDEMESLEISAAVKELKELEGGYLQKVYQVAEKRLLFRIHVPGVGKKVLLFILGKGLFLKEEHIETPREPNDYIMLLRKYIGNARITDIGQHEFDRVVVMELQSRKKHRLIFEIFSKGNLILTGEDQIMVPFRSESWKHRQLKEGEIYKYPPSRTEPFHLEEQQVRDILADSDSDLVRTLAVVFNLGGKYAEEVCARLALNKHTEDMDRYAEEIHEELRELKDRIHEKRLEPYVIYGDEDEDIIDAVPFELKIYEDKEKKQVETYNRALEMAFQLTDEAEKEESMSRAERKLEQQRRSLENLKKKENMSMVKAELIYQNYQLCEELLDNIIEAREGDDREEVFEDLEGRESVIQINDLDEYVIVNLEGRFDDKEYEENVKLDIRKDVNENASKYYQRSKKYRGKIEGAAKAIAETEKEIEEGGVEEEEEEWKPPTTKYWFDRYKWFISSDGNLVIAGKDTKTNEEVVKKYLEKGDRYVHAEAGGAPSVVVKKDEGEIRDRTLEEACQYSLIHSKEWKRGVAAGTAYWVKPYQVSKTAESGESLPTGAFVVRGERNYVTDIPLEAGLAEIRYEGDKKVMCAPAESLKGDRRDEEKKKVLFVPGKKKISDFAKDMSNYFNVPLKEIQKIIPPGGVKVIKRDQ